MPYRFSTEDQNYADFSGGRVFYNLPGAPAFPVRLASEIFQRAADHLALKRPLTLYDATCGGAYHLAALGFLHGNQIQAILASDVDEEVLKLAERNLGLLAEEGFTRREEELARMLAEYRKESHAEALHSAAVLRAMRSSAAPIRTRLFCANALDTQSLQSGLAGEQVDLVFSDIPYGQMTGWVLPGSAQEPGGPSPAWRMLDALLPLLPNHAILATAADKSQRIAHEGYQRIEQFNLGKRRVTLLRTA